MKRFLLDGLVFLDVLGEALDSAPVCRHERRLEVLVIGLLVPQERQEDVVSDLFFFFFNVVVVVQRGGLAIRFRPRVRRKKREWRGGRGAKGWGDSGEGSIIGKLAGEDRPHLSLAVSRFFAKRSLTDTEGEPI